MTTSVPLFTIDEPHSRDLDDAIGVERAAGGWKVRVAIANPSLEVAIGSDVDLRARRLGSTLYRGRAATEPMLPREISEARSTLTAGEPRAALLIDLSIDTSGRVHHTELSLGDIVVARRLSYADVPHIATDPGDELHQAMTDAIGLARGLLQQRRARGALAIYDQRRMLLTDEEGRIQQYDAETMIGHIVVQEFMVAANAAVAELAATREIPFLYRSHEPRISAPRGLAAAESFEAWMAGGTMSVAAVSERLNLVAQKARYTSVLTGHYGLNLPAYSHVTSPLRRYADLVDQRQLVAHILGRPLPYSQADLDTIGQELFDLVGAQAEETSNHFKAPVIARAEAALDAGDSLALRGLADNELGQAVKAAIEGESFVPLLVEELLRRMGDGTLADKVAVRLIEGRAMLPKALVEGFAGMLRARPAQAVSFVNHARAVGAVSAFEVLAEGVAAPGGAPSTDFVATSVISNADGGRTFRATGRASRKKDAEQAAILLAFCDFLGADRPAAAHDEPVAVRLSGFTAPAAATVEAPPGNPKGTLFELSQKMGLPVPEFETSSTGPSNAAVFTCLCTFDLRGSVLEARSQPATTKKAAEALAAHAMLKQIERHDIQQPKPPVVQPAAQAVVNPISQLQEIAQKQRLQPPSYSFEELSKTPSSFRCRVVLRLASSVVDVQATAASKQAAKTAAAEVALMELATTAADMA